MIGCYAKKIRYTKKDNSVNLFVHCIHNVLTSKPPALLQTILKNSAERIKSIIALLLARWIPGANIHFTGTLMSVFYLNKEILSKEAKQLSNKITGKTKQTSRQTNKQTEIWTAT